MRHNGNLVDIIVAVQERFKINYALAFDLLLSCLLCCVNSNSKFICHNFVQKKSFFVP